VVLKRMMFAIATAWFAAACAQPALPVLTIPAITIPEPPSTASPLTPAPAVAHDSAVTQIDQQGAPVSQAPAASPASPSETDSVHVSLKDVSRRAGEVFGDTLLAATDRADSATLAPSWDIEVRSYESTDRVEHYVRMFTGPARDRIQTRLERGTRYEAMIRAKLHAAGLPEDMYYLALIESGFDPNAYSRAAAVGMWQFMTSTARDMGMRVDWWIDERRDPMKSTAAAVRFIKDLKEQFGSLYLAAAAYNGGPGRIARGLSRYADDLEGTTGDDLFFALADKDYLRNETREYVPQLIAAALIAKEPDRYGMKLVALPSFSYDSVRVGPAIPLAAIAHAAGARLSEVKELNPQVLRGVTPPKGSVWIRVPVGAADSFPAALAALPTADRKGLSTAETKKGETLESIAHKAGISERQLALYNPTLKHFKSGRLVVGQPVLIPTEAVASAATSVPDPSIERYGSASVTAMHVVRHGETLSGIAKRYNTSTAALMKANGLRKALIYPGQTLVVRSARHRSAQKSVVAGRRKKSTPAKRAAH
jgi:membrane-bound lytic murein transglycosylase D